jgi:hypothetical protein
MAIFLYEGNVKVRGSSKSVAIAQDMNNRNVSDKLRNVFVTYRNEHTVTTFPLALPPN